MLDLAILGLLEEQDLHGYEIRRQLRDELGLLANISFGSLYPALTRLERPARSSPPRPPGPATRPPPAGPADRLAQRRAGRAAGPRATPPPAPAGGTKVYRITDDGPAAVRQLLGATSRPAPTTPAASGCGWPSPATSPPRPGWPCSSAAGPSWSSASAEAERRRAASASTSTPARWSSTRADGTEHDIAWLDRLIESERTRPYASAERTSRRTPIGHDRTHRRRQSMSSIRVAIAGVGNCASSLIQGVSTTATPIPATIVPGLMHVELGGYHVRDLEFVAAFDVDAAKVGTDLGKAIFAGQNNTIRFAEVGELGVTVQRGPTLDGLGKYYRETVEESPAEPVDVAAGPARRPGRRAGQLPAGRLRAGPALLRPGLPRRRRGLRQRHPRLHRLGPGVGPQVPRRRRPDRGRRHQEPGRARPSSTAS